MHLKNIFLTILLFFLIISCSKEEVKISIIQEDDLNLQVIEAYEEGLESLKEGDVLYAAKKFNEAEMLFPQSESAPKSALMAAYAYYIQDYYGDSIAELIRFLKVYPKDKNLDYAYYLLGICYFEQIVDEKKDMQSIIQSKETFKTLVKKFPNTEYAIDAKFKLDLIDDILASKEIYIGRYYLDKKKWIAAINRFRNVIDDYETTVYTEEALYRLVEVYYIIGLKEESKKYAQLLGYNYNSSAWYEKSYALFDKKYKERKKFLKNKEKKSNIVIRKFKSLFE
ncbi:outer membrane protein assembly factor BamD [Pelagibacterales bacterium SAG-MED08]|nr:outer membrane protein assembly factor BamD [Pelagibacterales bacterium SAG-MED08]